MKKYVALLIMAVLAISLLGGCRSTADDQLESMEDDTPTADIWKDPIYGLEEEEPEDPQDLIENPSDQPEKPSENKPSVQKPEKQPQKQESPKEEPQKQEPSNQETPKEETPKEESPKEEIKEQEPIDYSSWIKVASYNIKALNFNAKDPSKGSDQFAAVVAELKKIDADIVGLQEVDRFSPRKNADQVKDLAEALGYKYYKYTKTIDYGSGEYGHAIMSRYPILSTKTYAFADAPGNIDAQEPRAFSRHVLKVNDKRLVFYNSHLAEKGPNQLLYMVDHFMAKDVESGLSVVMTADFNAVPSQLIGCYDLDLFTLLNGGDDFENCVGTTNDNNSPIDNILVSDNLNYYWDAKKKCGIEVVNTLASDHKPIYTYINFK